MTDPDRRQEKLEEALAFTQHDLDGLSSEVRRLFDELGKLARRLDALDRRLTSLDNPETGDEAEA